ncbi:MAG: hypothetical protein HY455_02740 [Parcubacteria group bacterium]|nr:hypothetical protein [Parcubacteria group bacterium]
MTKPAGKHWLLYPNPIVDRGFLRGFARGLVEGSTLIANCGRGSPTAMRALLVGFWPFVYEFEKAIDAQSKRLPLRRLLKGRFSTEIAQQYFVSAAHVLRQMHEEEGEHARTWHDDASKMGLNLTTLGVARERVHCIQALIDKAYTDDPFKFFCALAATEYIAEELSAFLCGSRPFTEQLDGQFAWGELHIAHHDGPSHLEIDEDLARAVHPSEDSIVVAEDMKRETKAVELLFSQAAEEVLERARVDALDIT